jgi:hypothetical protein
MLVGCGTQVDGIRAYGRVHDVSTKDIRAAIAASRAARPGGANDVEVVSSTEIHVYRAPRYRDSGWNTVKRIKGKWIVTDYALVLNENW